MLVGMTEEEARHLLALSRELHWAFPSSQGTPIIKGQATSQQVEQAAVASDWVTERIVTR